MQTRRVTQVHVDDFFRIHWSLNVQHGWCQIQCSDNQIQRNRLWKSSRTQKESPNLGWSSRNQLQGVVCDVYLCFVFTEWKVVKAPGSWISNGWPGVTDGLVDLGGMANVQATLLKCSAFVPWFQSDQVVFRLLVLGGWLSSDKRIKWTPGGHCFFKG